MPSRTPIWPFLFMNAVVWVVMVVILVVVPDTLERWLSLEVSRVLGWAVACAVWVVSVEHQWKQRVGPLLRFLLQLGLWVSAALLAGWISAMFRLR
jgi:hypothetical protein